METKATISNENVAICKSFNMFDEYITKIAWKQTFLRKLFNSGVSIFVYPRLTPRLTLSKRDIVL